MFHRFRILTLVILLLLIARAMIPVGFMPDFANDKIAITICHGADIKTIFIDDDKAPTNKADVTCPFTPIVSVAVDIMPPLFNGYMLLAFLTLVYALMAQSEKVKGFYRASKPRAPPISFQ